MTTLLQISDTHFGTERESVMQALLRLVAEKKPTVIVLSGDVTQRARRRQFDAARNFAQRLAPATVIAVPGNHDIPLFNVFARLFQPYGNFRRAFGADLEPVFESDELLVVCVNTTRARRHKDGEVSLAQVQHVADRLRQARPAQARIVVLHHPVLAPTPQDLHNLLHGRTFAIPAWSEAGADVILAGHVHLPYFRSLRAEMPGLPRDVWTVQAGTAISRRTRGSVPNSVNLLHVRAAGSMRHCRVERWDYASEQFECRHAEDLRFGTERGDD